MGTSRGPRWLRTFVVAPIAVRRLARSMLEFTTRKSMASFFSSRVAGSTGSRKFLGRCPRTRRLSCGARRPVGVIFASRRGQPLVMSLLLLEVGRLTVLALVGASLIILVPVGMSRCSGPSGTECVWLPPWVRTGWRSSMARWSRVWRRSGLWPLPGLARLASLRVLCTVSAV